LQIREVELLNVSVAATSTRVQNGHWSLNCAQISYRNFSLTFTPGYEHSEDECVYCEYMEGPFVARDAMGQILEFSKKIVALLNVKFSI
jgi:hypothetical protein